MELKRIYKSPLFIAIVIILLCLIIFGTIYININISKYDGTNKIIYGITKYESFEELEQRIIDEKESLTIEQQMLKETLSYDIQDKDIIKVKQDRISYMETNINAMSLLLEKRINFENVKAYRDFNIKNGTSVMMSFNLIIAIIIFIISAIKIAIIIPSEIKEGQSKLTLTLPIGRINYALYKLVANLIFLLSLLIFFSVFSAIVCAIFFPVKDVFILFASPYQAICLSFMPSMFLQLAFSIITLIAVSLISFSISLLFRNQIVSLLLTLLFGLWGLVLDLFNNIISGNFIKYLLSYNLHIDKIFYNQTANPIWISALILVIYLGTILILSLLKFKKQDILN